MIAALLMFGTFAVLAPPAALIAFPWTLITRNPGFLYRTGIRIVRIGTRLAGIRVVLLGRSAVPRNDSCIFMCNHVSNLDPCVMVPPIPGRCSILVKQELMRVPILGAAMRMANFVSVSRAGDRQSAVESVRQAAAALRSGVHILVFPEGTRSRDGRLLPFKRGPFYLALESGAPIVPMTVTGTENMMQKGSMRVLPGTATVHFHEAVSPRDYENVDALLTAVRERIRSVLPSSMQPVETPEN
jgi:1-acyl-sn-glycerol-3-phosphate acyltransferase